MLDKKFFLFDRVEYKNSNMVDIASIIAAGVLENYQTPRDNQCKMLVRDLKVQGSFGGDCDR
jgi:hypothetical protein